MNSESSGNDLASWPVSIMDYLCEKFDGVLVETKVVREYYWNKHIRDLIDKKVGTHLNMFLETIIKPEEFDG